MDFKLKYETPIEWADQVIDNLDEFLQDHADAERKVSNMCMSIIAKYPDRTEIVADLTQTAMEELMHFKQVFKLIKSRGNHLDGKFKKDPYMQGLVPFVRTDRDGRFMDRLLLASVGELRGVERFKLLSERLPEGPIQKFYANLYKQEHEHVDTFVKMATVYFEEEDVEKRLNEILEKEAEVVQGLPWRPAIH